jgi:dimethylamine/trimethylamine dehydrogenase
MSDSSKYDVLFEPVRIGPKIAKNRFYQVPHCTGLGTNAPNSLARFREMKAEGGWAVVNTEECSFHPSTDVSPSAFEKLWSDEDLPGLQLMVDAVHRHGALAGIELCDNGGVAANVMTRERARSPSARLHWAASQAREMTKADIRELRKCHRAAAIRAKRAGFDIVYVYASHSVALPFEFLSKRYNRRSDDYGGAFDNRVRLIRELLEDTKEAIGDSCAVAFRFGVDEVLEAEGFTYRDEGRRVVEALAELPDLWDVNVNHLEFDMMTARFTEEGFQEPFTSFVKSVTSKPVVGVGRYTSPDRMVSLIRKGLLDLIGAARPSIADPFLPIKIQERRFEDIRECIGCNMCLSMQATGGPIRCTQNPTSGEEWRRGWHPEKIAPKKSDSRILVVGAGPAGLESAVSLGKRGYSVALFERRPALGGRVNLESTLPGLSSYRRVADYRIQQLNKLPNVEVYAGSEIFAKDLHNTDFTHLVLATGARWLRDGIGRANTRAVPGHDNPNVFTPDDVLAGVDIPGPVVIYDDEGYYIGGVIAEQLRKLNKKVVVVTPGIGASQLLQFTVEFSTVQQHLFKLGVEVISSNALRSVAVDHVQIADIYNNQVRQIEARSVVMVALREPNRELNSAILSEFDQQVLPFQLTSIGDCYAAATIADAVQGGHKYARAFDEVQPEGVGFLLERPVLHPPSGTSG